MHGEPRGAIKSFLELYIKPFFISNADFSDPPIGAFNQTTIHLSIISFS